MILALVRDLMFASKITATARSVGISVRIVRKPDDLTGVDGVLLLVDLNQEGATHAAANWRKRTGRPAIGFVSHVDADTAVRAKSTGIDRVLARSRFVELLPDLLVNTQPGPVLQEGST